MAGTRSPCGLNSLHASAARRGDFFCPGTLKLPKLPRRSFSFRPGRLNGAAKWGEHPPRFPVTFVTFVTVDDAGCRHGRVPVPSVLSPRSRSGRGLAGLARLCAQGRRRDAPAPMVTANIGNIRRSLPRRRPGSVLSSRNRPGARAGRPFDPSTWLRRAFAQDIPCSALRPSAAPLRVGPLGLGELRFTADTAPSGRRAGGGRAARSCGRLGGWPSRGGGRGRCACLGVGCGHGRRARRGAWCRAGRPAPGRSAGPRLVPPPPAACRPRSPRPRTVS